MSEKTTTKFGIWRGWRTKQFLAGKVKQVGVTGDAWMATGAQQPQDVTEEITRVIAEVTWPFICRLMQEHPDAARDILTAEFVDKAHQAGIDPVDILAVFDDYMLEKEVSK